MNKITIVTGGAGFIGSRIIKKLNDMTNFNILMVDDLTDADKIKNIKDLVIADYIDKDDFIDTFVELSKLGVVDSVYHFGAESSTTETDGKYLMKNNFQYTCSIADICAKHGIPLLYASSASVYGDSDVFDSNYDNYQPNNMYGFSKLQADRYIRQLITPSKIIGVRLFNVYSDGEFEQHKDKAGMKSPTAWMKDQLEEHGEVSLFEGSENYKRDFIHVNNVVDKCIELQNSDIHGIWNLGTGKARSFVDMAKLVDKDIKIKYIPMPENIKKGYQSYTCADMDSFPLNNNKLDLIKEGLDRARYNQEQMERDKKDRLTNGENEEYGVDNRPHKMFRRPEDENS